MSSLLSDNECADTHSAETEHRRFISAGEMVRLMMDDSSNFWSEHACQLLLLIFNFLGLHESDDNRQLQINMLAEILCEQKFTNMEALSELEENDIIFSDEQKLRFLWIWGDATKEGFVQQLHEASVLNWYEINRNKSIQCLKFFLKKIGFISDEDQDYIFSSIIISAITGGDPTFKDLGILTVRLYTSPKRIIDVFTRIISEEFTPDALLDVTGSFNEFIDEIKLKVPVSDEDVSLLYSLISNDVSLDINGKVVNELDEISSSSSGDDEFINKKQKLDHEFDNDNGCTSEDNNSESGSESGSEENDEEDEKDGDDEEDDEEDDEDEDDEEDDEDDDETQYSSSKSDSNEDDSNSNAESENYDDE